MSVTTALLLRNYDGSYDKVKHVTEPMEAILCISVYSCNPNWEVHGTPITSISDQTELQYHEQLRTRLEKTNPFYVQFIVDQSTSLQMQTI